MKPILIKSFAALIAAIVTSFFVFAMQGMHKAALAMGILAILSLFIKGLSVSPAAANNPIWMPSRSQRRKLRRLKFAKG